MRTFSTAVSSLLNYDYIEYFILIKMELANTYYLTTHSADITVEGNTYLANGAIFSYDAPKQNSILDRDAYNISFIDPEDSLFSEFKAGVVGKNITVRAGFISPTAGPLTSTTDLVYIYQGYVDSPSIQNDFNSKIVSIQCSSPMADFDMVRPFFTTPYGMDQYAPSDTSFDRINDGYDLQLKWGKA